MPHRISRRLPALLLLSVFSCDRGPTEPSHAPATVTLDRVALALDDSASATLTATVLDAAGLPATLPSSGVVWTSSDPLIATVRAGVVTGEHPGSATIIATAGTARANAAVTVRQVATALERVRGDSLMGTVATPLADSLVVRVVDRHHEPVAGATVTFATRNVGGVVSPSTVTTDATGLAAARWTLGTVAGAQSATATFDGKPLALGATARAGPAVKLAIVPDSAVYAGYHLPVIFKYSTGVARQISAVASDVYGNVVASAPQWALHFRFGGPITLGATVTADGRLSAPVATIPSSIPDFDNVLVATVGALTDSVVVGFAPPLIATFDGPSADSTVVTPADSANVVFRYATQYGFGPRTQLTVDGQSATSASLARGTHTLRVTVIDPGGMTASSERRISVVAAPTSQYALTVLGTLGGADSRAAAINDAGTVVGSALTAAGESRAVVWRDGVVTELAADLPAPSNAVAVNAIGQIAGTYGGCASAGSLRSFLISNGARLLFEQCGAGAADLNARGTVLFGYPGYIWRGGTMEPVVMANSSAYSPPSYYTFAGRLNDRDGVLFQCFSGQGKLCSGTSTYIYPDDWQIRSAVEAIGGAVSTSGDIAGYCSKPSTLSASCGAGGLRLSGATLTTVSFSTLALNNKRQVAGLVRGSATVALWDQPTNQLYGITLSDPSWVVDEIVRMNDKGQIAAHAHNTATGQKSGVLLSPR